MTDAAHRLAALYVTVFTSLDRIPRPMAITRLPLRETPWGPSEPERPCPVCGGWWRPWVGSTMPCHARCLLYEWAQDELADLKESEARIALRLGLKLTVVRASIQEALRRRKAKR